MIKSQKLKSPANAKALENLARVFWPSPPGSLDKPIALLGAGMSARADFPTWSGLLDQLDQALGPMDHPMDHRYREMLRKEPDMLWRAHEYRRLLLEKSPKAFDAAIKSIFGKEPQLKEDDPTTKFIGLPFKHIITTNYDDVIRSAHKSCDMPVPRKMTWNADDVREFIYGLGGQRAERCLLHLHGHHDDPASIILSEDDYTERYVRTFGTFSKLFAIFSTERVVFAGFSLNDPDLMEILREVNATMQGDIPRHFAIMPIDRPGREVIERSRLRARYGVEPIFYRPLGKDHSGLLEIIDELLDLKTAQLPTTYKTLSNEQLTTPARNGKIRFDPDDPEKGRWGGQKKAGGRQVRAWVRALSVDWFEVTIEVESSNKQKLTGDVVFHLHPTLIPRVRVVTAVDGVARLKVQSYGAYTVGIETDSGTKHLEIDLATQVESIETAPMMFLMN